jgi:hypothetical protein
VGKAAGMNLVGDLRLDLGDYSLAFFCDELMDLEYIEAFQPLLF